jgi:predicted short-subunit dehydrogenase-like oxidoreductase (DUF2520 family)
MKIAILGSGNVAEALVEAGSRAGPRVQITQICARNEAEGRRLAAMAGAGWISTPEELVPADLYIVAVSDRAVATLAGRIPAPRGAVVAHTAGSVEMDVLSFAERGVLYPMQSFSRGRAVEMREVPLFVEYSSPHAAEVLRETAKCLSCRVLEADSTTRAWLHLAAVFAANFTNHLYAVADGLLSSHGLEFDLLRPLITEIAAKAASSGSPAVVQTGPAARGDVETMRGHAEMLSAAGLEREREIYELISNEIWRTSKN